jgi:GNAT superfamily N-acetyltransferase
MIRELKAEELTLLYRVGHEFFREAKLPGKFVESVFLKNFTGLVKAGSGHCFGAFKDADLVGALGCIVWNDLYDDAKTSVESFWYVFEEHRGQGVRLMKHYEQWAIKNGIKRCMMGCIAGLHDVELGDFYERSGYRRLETTFVKVL